MGPTGMAANDNQVGGDHYKTGGLEHWDMVVHFKLDYFQGQITKYVMRWRDKGGIADLKKAQHFLEKYIEVATKEEMDRKLAPPPGWTVKYDGTKMVASYAREAGSSEKVAGKKVRPARGKR